MSIPPPGSTRPWSGRAVTEARAIVATWLPLPCGQCGETVDGRRPWVIGHTKSRIEYPALTWVMTNWRVEHRACSNRSSQAVVVAKARNDVRRELGLTPEDAGSSPTGDPSEASPLPFSPPDPPSQPALSGLVLPFPTGKPMETREDLAWSPDFMRTVPWLAQFADVPEDASPPLYMTRPPDDAVCSYGWSECVHLDGNPDAVAWIEDTERKRLRWWQRLAVVVQLQHREDGTLCAREYIESAPRRAGKSVRMRGVSLWRLSYHWLFGERQLVMHTGSDMAICREIQRGAWRWAETTWGKGTVTQANGKECIESPEGDRWLVRSQDGVYGYDVTLANVDEAWDVKPETVTEGLEPATLERSSPQVCLTSTAHRRATSLMRGKIATALVAYDPEVVIIVWAARPGADPADPATWRDASPHWSEDRRKLIGRKYEAALAGQVDPQADDPDPMAGFTAQYLNVWRLTERASQKGEPVTSADAWEALAAGRPDGVPAAVAIESWFAAGVSVVAAWPVGGRVLVTATNHATVQAAADYLRARGWRRPIVGASMEDDPALRGLGPRRGAGRTAAAVNDMIGLLREEVVRHDGGDHLTEQVTTVRVTPGADGPRLVGGARADAIKAAVWAITEARTKAGRAGKLRILLPS